jgi:hypothetical protein
VVRRQLHDLWSWAAACSYKLLHTIFFKRSLILYLTQYMMTNVKLKLCLRPLITKLGEHFQIFTAPESSFEPPGKLGQIISSKKGSENISQIFTAPNYESPMHFSTGCWWYAGAVEVVLPANPLLLQVPKPGWCAKAVFSWELTVNEAELFLKFKSKNIPEFCIAVDDYTYEAMR